MDEDSHVHTEDTMFQESLATLREIRRQGRLCDIVLKVKNSPICLFVIMKKISKIF